jgi:hypothetical protein
LACIDYAISCETTAIERRTPMRVALSLVALALPFFAACAEDKPPGEESDADTDADSDTDADADTDADTDAADAGDDIASATSVAYSDGKTPSASDAIREAGDRDFFTIDMAEGETTMAFTFAYALDGDADPDTVLRIYDGAGTMLVENDDMPLRVLETDSAILFQAPAADTYYFEVLEWSDWDPTSEGPAGGPDWEYDFYALAFAPEEPDPNDTMEEVDAIIDAGDYVFWSNLFDNEFYVDFYADIDSATDVDLFRFDLENDDYVAVILWPGYWPAADLEVTLYDESGAVLAQTDEPEYTTENSITFSDMALLYRAGPGTYYFGIRDLAGTSGAGTYYGGMLALYLVDGIPLEAENNDVILAGNNLEITESDTTAGYYYGYVAGTLDASDDIDAYHVSAADVGGTLEGMYVSFLVQAAEVGSLLDAKVTIYSSDGSTVLESTSVSDITGSDDPAAVDVEVPAGVDDVYIAVEVESSDANPDANQYIGEIQIFAETQYE